MEKIDFLVGSEKRFSEFISGLNDKDKIALISHNDLDGIGAAKVVNEVVNPNIIKFVEYTDLGNNLVDELKKEKIKRVIFTDISIHDFEFIRAIEKFADILIIDHHKITKDWNSDKTIYLVAEGYCAAYISYYLFSKIQNIEKLDWVITCSCLADWCFFKNQEFMKEIYKKYGLIFSSDKDKVKIGKFWDLQYKISLALVYFERDVRKVFDSIGYEFGDVGNMGNYSSEVQGEIDSFLKKFDEEKIDIIGGYFWEFNPTFNIKSILINIISMRKEMFNKTLIFAKPEGEFYKISARRQDGRENMNEFVKKIINGLERADGGGHVPAAGGHCLLKDKEEFKKRLGILK